MLMGRVVGTVWSTRKEPSLEGIRFLMVRPFTTGREEAQDIVVAGDVIGAGVGETVLVAFGRAARTTLGSQDVGWQAAVVGIVDAISLQDGSSFELGPSGERIPTP
jgi:ethanolamine utilization protein EutN